MKRNPAQAVCDGDSDGVKAKVGRVSPACGGLRVGLSRSPSAVMIASLLLLSLSCACCLAAKEEPAEPLNCPPPVMNLRTGQNLNQLDRGNKFVDFDWNLSQELNAVEKGNIVISPISLKVVLAMLYEGAKGKTALEIAEALDLTNTTSTPFRMTSRNRFSAILKSLETSKGKYEIKIGTHVFIDKNAEPKIDYQCKLQNYYNSAMQKVDFSNTTAAVNTINNWASNETEGHIQHLISEAEAHSSTIMLLLNAVYFKGIWEAPFPEDKTRFAPFYMDDRGSVDCPIMNITGRFSYYNITDLNAQIIRLPYSGEKFAMYIILPDRRSGLDNLTRALGPERPLTGYLQNMTMTTVNLLLPRFEFDFTASLRPTLEKLGIKRMFTQEADLSDIADTAAGGDLIVSNVLQKAGISVRETGTVAYAATVVELMDKFGGDSEEVIHFKANHPFLFFIEDESTKTTVFVGKLTNPEENGKTPSSPTPEPPFEGSNSVPEEDTALVEEPECAGTLCATQNKITDQEASHARYNNFDADFLQELGKAESGNFVISTASIKSLLALLFEGAEGTTLSELQTLMRLPSNRTQARKLLSALPTALQKASNSKVTVDSVSKVFISNKLTANTTYGKSIKDYYKADVSQQDFSSPVVAANTINSWVNSRTRGLIPTLVDPSMINSDTYAVLTNAVYFNGKWKTQFTLKETKERCFYTEPNMECQMVPMMAKSEELYYNFDSSLDSHVLQIPYEDDQFSMVIVLPRKKDGMKQLHFDSARINFPSILQKVNLYEVNLKLPRFTIEYGTELIDLLKKMGLSEVFSERADLPYMINNNTGKVSAMIHKAKIEVSEKGTKAAAASGAAVVPLMFGLDPINLTVDHPFYYFIYERDSRTVLFSGRLSSIEGAVSNQSASNAEPLSLNTNSKPSVRPAHNAKYTTTRRYQQSTESVIHFPNKSTNSLDRKYIQYEQDSNKHH